MSNKRRLGLTEFDAVSDMINGLKIIIKKEVELSLMEVPFGAELMAEIQKQVSEE